MTRQNNNTLKLCVRLFVSSALLLFLFYHLDWSLLWGSLSSVQIWPLVWVFLLLVPGFVVRSYRWLILFNTADVSLRFWIAFKILMIGLCLNLILPASLGDVAKSYYGYKWSGIKERMLSISVLDKVVAVGSVCLLGLVFSFYAQHLGYGLLSLCGTVLGGLVLTFLHLANWRRLKRPIGVLSGWLKNKIDLFQVIDQSRTSFGKLLAAIALSLVGWLITYFQLYLIVRGLSLDVSLVYVFSIAPFLTLVRMFPFALQGLGTDELAICFVFQQVGIPYEKSIAVALLYRLFLIIIPGLAGLCFLWELNPKKHNEVNL